jgi:TPR repeat protein
VPEDHALALRLFRLAAEQGDADAQNNLRGMYAEGLGVAADPVEAYMWFELAASAGHETAIRNRGYLAEGMSAAKIDDAARARSWRAAHLRPVGATGRQILKVPPRVARQVLRAPPVGARRPAASACA